MMTEKWESVTSLLPAGRRLLASCFDAHHTTGGGLFSLGESVEEIDRISSTGLYYEDGRLLRCLWSDDGSPAELIVYDATGVLRYHRLDGADALTAASCRGPFAGPGMEQAALAGATMHEAFFLPPREPRGPTSRRMSASAMLTFISGRRSCRPGFRQSSF